MTLLRLDNLTVRIDAEENFIRPVERVSLSLNKHESLGIVGESGCGKTMLGLSIMKLLPRPAGRIESGKILWDEEDLVAASEERMRRLRGKEMGLIFQEPMTSLNPVMSIGAQIGEAIAIHNDLSRREISDRTIELLELVGISDPKLRAKNYPYELSGGMRQRAMIAMSLSCSPKLLIADEPTTALDVTIQAQILNLISELQKKLGMAMLLITHDFGVVAEVTHRVIVMYAGQFMEEGATDDVFANPMHPYTISLLRSLPERTKGPLHTIPGRVPEFSALPKGCRFASRCPKAQAVCSEGPIEYTDKGSGRKVRCLFPGAWE